MRNPEKPGPQNDPLEIRPLTFEELEQKEGLEVIEHAYGKSGARVREYIDPSEHPLLSAVAIKNMLEKLNEGNFTGSFAGTKRHETEKLQTATEIVFVTPEGKPFLFSTFTPEEYGFARYPETDITMVDHDAQLVIYSKTLKLQELEKDGRWVFREYPMFEASGTNLTMLHEIGHAHQHSRRAEDDENDITRRMILLDKAEEGLPRRDHKEYIHRVLLYERDAWAWALSELKRLRREGVDLEPDMKDEDLKLFAHQALLAYEIPLGHKAEPWEDLSELSRRMLRPKREKPKEK